MTRVPLWVVLLVGIAWGLAIGHVVRVYDARRVQAQVSEFRRMADEQARALEDLAAQEGRP